MSSTIIDTIWYTTHLGKLIGIVKCEDDVTKEIKYYIGDGAGVDEKTDAEFIHQFGDKFFPNMSIFKNG